MAGRIEAQISQRVNFLIKFSRLWVDKATSSLSRSFLYPLKNLPKSTINFHLLTPLTLQRKSTKKADGKTKRTHCNFFWSKSPNNCEAWQRRKNTFTEIYTCFEKHLVLTRIYWFHKDSSKVLHIITSVFYIIPLSKTRE